MGLTNKQRVSPYMFLRKNQINPDLEPIEGIDPGIEPVVELFRHKGVETSESCEGGKGHASHEPVIYFAGDRWEGYKVVAIAMQHGLPLAELRRVWRMHEDELEGPEWVVTFISQDLKRLLARFKDD